MSKDSQNTASNRPSGETSLGARPNFLMAVMEIFGIGRAVTLSVVLLVVALVSSVIYVCIWSAPPRTLTITTGPEGSVFHTNAWKYGPILARYGVKLNILTSHGSEENLQRLSDPSARVDVGMVLSGVTNNEMDRLISLGTISYQPLLVFYRGAPVELLSEFAGKRMAIGESGSGTHTLALTLLDANGIKTNSTLLSLGGKDASSALLEGRADAVFLMGEDASPAVLRELLRAPDVRLFSFKQATAYARRYNYLSELVLPQGSIDFGRNIPAQDVKLIGPTVELVARDKLHPALSDLMLQAAREVHGRATLLQHKNEFPAPLEHDLRISPDAARFYKSGKSFFYRLPLPLWLASLISRVVVVILPMIVVLIPLLRSIPSIYRWRMRSRIYRRYRALLALERELFNTPDPLQRRRLGKRLDDIERAVNRMRVPASFADQFYSLRGHIDYVRRLKDEGSGEGTAAMQDG